MKAILKNSKNSNIKELYYYKGDGEYISNITNLPLYYSEELDLYII